jgi:hypothetical protein
MATTRSPGCSEPPARARRQFRHPVLAGGVYLLWVALLCWGGLKFFWWWQFGVAVTETPGVDTVWRFYYPELYLSGAMDAKLTPDDGSYDVLLLGGSVLEQTAPAEWLQIPANRSGLLNKSAFWQERCFGGRSLRLF